MGNSDIRDIAHIDSVERNEISGNRVAVDASNWLYRYMTTTAKFTRTEAYTNGNETELSNLIGVPIGIRKFFQNNLQPVFVFDGAPNPLKRGEIERRKKKRSKAAEKAEQAEDGVEKSKYESRSQQLSDDVIETTQKLLDLLDVPYVTAPSAAEAQTAHMTRTDDFTAAVSDDYDSVVFGAELTVRKFTTSSDNVELMSLEETLRKHNFSRKHLILCIILCGSDYNEGVSGVGPKTSVDLVKSNPSVDELRSELDEKLPRADKIFDLYENPDVVDEWPTPKASSPDIDAVREYLREQQIDVSEVEKALSDIEDTGSQTGLNTF